MNKESVAIRYDFDGYGYKYIDSGSGSDWQTRVQGEPLYTAPPQHESTCAECDKKQSDGWALYCVDCLREFYKHDPTNKREWVGLTDEEIKAFDTWHDNREEEVGWCNPSEIVAYIEAKLRSKNNG
jgi:hypothetical protein